MGFAGIQGIVTLGQVCANIKQLLDYWRKGAGSAVFQNGWGRRLPDRHTCSNRQKSELKGNPDIAKRPQSMARLQQKQKQARLYGPDGSPLSARVIAGQS